MLGGLRMKSENWKQMNKNLKIQCLIICVNLNINWRPINNNLCAMPTKVIKSEQKI